MRVQWLILWTLWSAAAWAQAPDGPAKAAGDAKGAGQATAPSDAKGSSEAKAPSDAKAPGDAKAPAESGADVALLEGVVRAKGRDKSAAEEVAKAYARIAQLHDAKSEFKSAADARERLLGWFEAQGLARDGGAIAAIAAQARLALLEPQVRKELERKLMDGTKPHPEARKHLEAWHEAVAATLPLLGRPAKPTKAPCLIDQLAKVSDFKALAPGRQAGLAAGLLLMALSSQTAALAAAEAPASQGPLVEQSKIYRDEAARIWEAHWRQADVPGQRDAVALEIRKQLSLIKPAEFPPLDQKVDDQLTPQQQEASKLASLAQRSTNPVLKVKYLEKALALDPDNAQLKEMLRAAQAERDADQRSKP